MREDGSSIYGPAGRMGLGATSEENLEDPFSAYRLKKSSNYRVRVEERLKYGPEVTAQKCYKCGKAGHIARECKA